MAKLRIRYGNAGPEYRTKLIDQAVEIMGFHRKSAIRALNAPNKVKGEKTGKAGRPAKYDKALLLEPLKAFGLKGSSHAANVWWQ